MRSTPWSTSCAPTESRRRSRASGSSPAELMVVGDADQSIYAFRGASIRNILDFEQDFPDATTILLEQNYRSTQTILNAANAVIGHNQGRKPKRLWSQAGDGERIVGYVADDERDEARFVSEEIDKLTDSRCGPARRGRGVLPHQRPVAGVRGDLHPARHALQGGRRGPLLRAPRGARRARLPADAGQSGRRDLPAPGAQHPEARDRRPGRGVRAVPGRPRPDHVLGGPAARGGRPRAGHPVAEGDRGLRRPGRRAAVDGRRGGACRRHPRVGPRPHRLPRRARGLRRPAGRHPGGEPRRAGGRGAGVLRRPRRRALGRPGRRRRRHARSRGSPTSWSGWRSSPTPTRSPTPPTSRTTGWSR